MAWSTNGIGWHSAAVRGLAAGMLLPLGALAQDDAEIPAVATPEPPEVVALARPTVEQSAWQDLELGLFIHLGPQTWAGTETDAMSVPISQVDPVHLNTDEWVAAAASLGARIVMFTARPQGGFAWWQTKTSSDYGVRSIPWRRAEGQERTKADVLKDLSESCGRGALQLGVLMSSESIPLHSRPGGISTVAGEQPTVDRLNRDALTSLLTKYGPISAVWFAGGLEVDVSDIVALHGRTAMICHGPLANVREHAGPLPDPTWCAASDGGESASGDEGGRVWLPPVCVVPLRDTFFWNPASEPSVKGVAQLLDLYERTVGRGGVLLLSVGPDTSGRIPGPDVARLAEFGEALRDKFAEPLATTAGEGSVVELTLAAPAGVACVVLQELIEGGQRVREYVVEANVEGAWMEVARGFSMGHKRVHSIAPIRTDRLRLRVLTSVGNPLLRTFSAFE